MSASFLSRLKQLGATPAALAGLEAVLQSPFTLPSHVVFVRRSDVASHLHIVDEGWACSSIGLRDGRNQTVAVALPGDVCDLQTLALGGCSFQVAALTPCRIARLPLAPLRDLLACDASLADALRRQSALQGQIATEWMVNLGRRSAAERIAHLLCELAVRLGVEPTDGAVRFAFPMTQSELADATGLSVVHVNRSLQALRRDVGLAIERRQAIIPSWADLVRFAEFDPDYLSVARSPHLRSRSDLEIAATRGA